MKVKILIDTVANKKIVKAGDVIDVKDSDARLLIGIKKAALYKEEQPQQQPGDEASAPVAKPEQGEEPAPKKKGKKS